MRAHKRNTKRGNLLGITVTFVLALMAIIALSWVVFKILLAIGVISPSIQCDWSIVLIAISKLGTAGLLDIPPECKVELITITEQDLDALRPEAQRAMELYQRDNRYAAFRTTFGDPGNEALQYEWALNARIAQAMQRCWGKVWEGKLPIFDSWWNLLDYEGLEKSRTTTPTSAYQQYQQLKLPGTDRTLFTVYGPPTFCIWCARIKFDKATQKRFGNRQIDTLDEYFKATQRAAGSAESIYEYLLDETQKEFKEDSRVKQRTWPYKVADGPLAVGYARVNQWGADLTHYGGSVTLEGLADFLGVSSQTKSARVNLLYLRPQQEVAFPLGRHAVPNSATQPIQCLQIIK